MSGMTWAAIFDALQVVPAADLDKATQIEQKALREAESIREEARAEGFAHGRSEGRKAIQKDFEKAVAAWSTGVAEFERSVKTRVQSESAGVLEAAALLAHRVLQTELKDSSAMERHLNDILLEDHAEQSVAIFASPSDRETITNAQSRISAIQKARVESDAALGAGDLRIEYKNHLVDARLWIMLQRGVDVLRDTVGK